MSSVNRSTARGGKGAKPDACSSNKTQKSDSKSDSPKSVDPKIQPTAEQMRIAQIIETKFEDADLKDKIKQVMDATRKSEDEVCTALHDCDNDPDRAVNMLLEGMAQGEWETSVKKKKIRQPSTAKSESPGNNRETEQEDWSVEREPNPERERSRTRGGGPPRMRGRGSLDNRGWRGRENKENERNLEDSREGGYRRGMGRMMNGPGRSGRGGRGGGRLGPRTFQSRDKGGFSRPIETWNNPCSEDSSGDALKMGKLSNNVDAAEDWNDDTYDARCGPNIGGGNISDKWGDFPSPEDWDNEEYTGSLADSKVFTPSGGAAEPSVTSVEPLTETTNVSETVQPFATQSLSSSIPVSSSQDVHTAPPQLSQSPIQVSMGSLSAAQSEYLSQFTQSESLKSAVGIGSSSGVGVSSSFGAVSTSYPAASSTAYHTPSPPSGFTATSAASFSTANYVGSSSTYGTQIQDSSLEVPSSAAPPTQTLPSRTKTQRPRVPPPSKIPSSAVEMPGDAVNNSIAYLDVQFGGLEFGSETSSFDSTVTSSADQQQTKYQSSVLDTLPSTRTSSNLSDLTASVPTSTLDGYSTSSTQKSSLVQNQKLSSVDSSILSSEHGKSSQVNYSQPSRVSGSSAGLDIDKSDVGLSYSVPSTASYQSYQQSQKSGSSNYQQPASSYSTSSYSSPQVSVSTTVFSSNQAPMSYASSTQPSSFQTSSYSQASMGYQGGGGGYPSLNQTGSTSTFSATVPYQGSMYGATQSVYGGYVPAAASVPHYQNSYGQSVATTTQNHTKLGSSLNSTPKDSQYEAAVVTTCASLSSSNNSTTLAANVNASPALGLAASQTVSSTSTKVSSSSELCESRQYQEIAGNKSSMVAGMPPGVTPIMGTHQYIMSQGGLPYFQQPVYTYEDLQMVQQRIPHMATAGYYDMGFQAPTSLATGREGTLANVAYSMSDGRFARTDNASPVPSTIPQQNATQAHQQPMLNAATLPPAYAYFYGGGMMPGSFQYGTPALYPMPPATNTHGSSSSTQYAKPGSYSSGYGPGYDGLSQNPDYGKTSYVSANQAQGKAGASAGSGGSSAADLGAPMYGAKSHVALSKVNSYEKQGFHSGTPPPFNMAGSQSTPMTPGGAYAPHLFIPTMPPHQQHHSTQLIHQPLHQMELRNAGRRSEGSGSSNQRTQSAAQPKAGAKQGYSPSYWTPN